MLELPENWDVIHLGGATSCDYMQFYSPNLLKCIKKWGAYAYIVNKKSIPILINELNKENTQVDTHYTNIQSDLNWFKSREMLVYHLEGYSDIEQKHRNITELYK